MACGPSRAERSGGDEPASSALCGLLSVSACHSELVLRSAFLSSSSSSYRFVAPSTYQVWEFYFFSYCFHTLPNFRCCKMINFSL